MIKWISVQILLKYFSKGKRRNNGLIPYRRVGPFDNQFTTNSRTPGNYARNWTKRKKVTIVQRGSHLSEVSSPRKFGIWRLRYSRKPTPDTCSRVKRTLGGYPPGRVSSTTKCVTEVTTVIPMQRAAVQHSRTALAPTHHDTMLETK